MRHLLKRLELNGFKSFAQRTVLEFPTGITAIVGPNGSGKSNVVDAIRWLLGERDAKNLRGAKVEDLIFAGTQKRPRLGQAQAALTFSNDNHFFPLDAAEVTVTREVRRDGTSKYFLNKSEVLLRDLVDFFAKVRLGSRGLVVITQGNSDVFIRATPSARREMIEEILGLREYQIKKAEAERRLKNSEINLEKAKALLEEILPHLRSLKRQTARWEKRGLLEEELRTLENQFFGSQWLEIEERLSLLRAQIEAHIKQSHVLHKEKERAEEHVRKVEESEPRERAELREMKSQTQLLLERRSVLEKEIGRLEAEIEFYSRRGATPSRSSEEYMRFLKEVRQGLSEALSDGEQELAISVRSLVQEIDSFLVHTSSRDEEDEEKKVRARFTEIHDELRKLQESMTVLKTKESHLEKSQEQFYQSFKTAVASLEEVKDKLEKWEAEHQKKLFEKERLELRREELTRHIHQAERDPKELQKLVGEKGIERMPAHELPNVERRIYKLRGDLASIGDVDEALVKEARDTEERYEFLKKEVGDLHKAKTDLKQLIRDLSEKIKTEFHDALAEINSGFNTFFTAMFDGGHAKLRLVVPKPAPQTAEKSDEDERAEKKVDDQEKSEESEGGIEIELRLPRKRISSLEILSGGERSLVGIAALFALISVSPPPFLVLDEIDAALDERNARRFAEMLAEFAKKTQFLVVTHNRATMEAAHILYGVTLSDDGTSKLLSLKLEG